MFCARSQYIIHSTYCRFSFFTVVVKGALKNILQENIGSVAYYRRFIIIVILS